MDNPITRIKCIGDMFEQLSLPLPLFGTPIPGPLTFSFHWLTKEPVIEIHHTDWITDIMSKLGPACQDTVGRHIISLKAAVLALYHLGDRDSLVPKEHINGAFRALKEKLLYCAIQTRIQGNLQRYTTLLPLACIGELIVLTLRSPSSTVRGHLCGWDAHGKDELRYTISQQGQMAQINVNWKRVAGFQASGETGLLHEHILRFLTDI